MNALWDDVPPEKQRDIFHKQRYLESIIDVIKLRTVDKDTFPSGLALSKLFSSLDRSPDGHFVEYAIPLATPVDIGHLQQ